MIDPLLSLAESLETSSGGLAGIPGDLTTIVDPALLQALGELGLTEDLQVLGAVEDGTRLTLEAGEQRRRLKNRFQREQELTGADLSERGIFIDADNNEGLVANVANRLGESQGERLGDFNAAVGDDMRAILTGLGQGQLGNVTNLGSTFLSSISNSLQGVLDEQQTRNDVELETLKTVL